jgi:hypothetical protein
MPVTFLGAFHFILATQLSRYYYVHIKDEKNVAQKVFGHLSTSNVGNRASNGLGERYRMVTNPRLV